MGKEQKILERAKKQGTGPSTFPPFLQLTSSTSADTFKSLPLALGSVLGSAGALRSPRTSSLLFPPHSLRLTAAFGCLVMPQLQASATKLFLSPGSSSRDSASASCGAQPATRGLSPRRQPADARGSTQSTLQKRKGTVPLMN